MVTRIKIRRFWRDEQGIALVEAMMILPIMLIIITTMIEFGVAVLQWNQSVKALQVGARLLAVSTPMVDDPSTTLVNEYEVYMSGDYGTTPEGQPVPGQIPGIVLWFWHDSLSRIADAASAHRRRQQLRRDHAFD